MYFELLWTEFASLPEVEAIALGGSRAGTDYDEKCAARQGTAGAS